MLTAAVAGDVFASPPTEAVLAAIRTVTNEAGVLVIIKNYTGHIPLLPAVMRTPRTTSCSCTVNVTAAKGPPRDKQTCCMTVIKADLCLADELKFATDNLT